MVTRDDLRKQRQSSPVKSMLKDYSILPKMTERRKVLHNVSESEPDDVKSYASEREEWQ